MVLIIFVVFKVVRVVYMVFIDWIMWLGLKCGIFWFVVFFSNLISLLLNVFSSIVSLYLDIVVLME